MDKAQEILAVGEVLWDLLPSGKQLGGAPANFTYQCRCLGAEARLVTRVGNDDLGREILERLRLLGLSTGMVPIDPERPTGTVDVDVAPDGQPRFTIREPVAWDEITADADALALAAQAEAIYFGSLAQRSITTRRAIRSLLEASRPDAIRIFDVNLRPPFVDRTTLEESLTLANALKLNDQELPELAAMFGLPGGVREAMSAMADRFDLSLVALTRGADGSLLWADGLWSEDCGQPVAVCDTIGAGDAFTAALVVGRLAGRTLNEINRHANAVAAFVCSRPGGTPALPEALRNPREDTSEDRR